jgi:simple sugar transport system ATP-binding protein
MNFVLSLIGITKAYPGILACSDVSAEFSGGEIHALIGDNGAGKSTLVKILAGVIQPDAGMIEIGGRAIKLSGPQSARAQGIGVIHQSSSLIDTMTVKDNLLIGTFNNPAREVAVWKRASEVSPLPGIPLERYVHNLSPRERQILEIHQLLAQKVNLLILDEPTSALSPQESARLFSELRSLAKSGLGVLVVSHKMPELLTHADRFTVLRKGRVEASLSRKEVEPSNLSVSLGADVCDQSPAKTAAEEGPCRKVRTALVQIRDLSTQSKSPYESSLTKVNLPLYRGEILGVAARPGSGVNTLVNLFYGEQVFQNPFSVIEGKVEWAAGNEKARKRCIGLIPADRLSSGVVGSMTIADNLALRQRNLLSCLWVSYQRKSLRKFAENLISQYDIRPANPDLEVQNLSGGNLQKVIVAREVAYAEELLLALNPTAGLDATSTKFVRQLLREKAAGGLCVLLHSDDLDELAEIADRVIVLSRGSCVDELAGARLNPESIGKALGDVGFSNPSNDHSLRHNDFVLCTN